MNANAGAFKMFAGLKMAGGKNHKLGCNNHIIHKTTSRTALRACL